MTPGPFIVGVLLLYSISVSAIGTFSAVASEYNLTPSGFVVVICSITKLCGRINPFCYRKQALWCSVSRPENKRASCHFQNRLFIVLTLLFTSGGTSAGGMLINDKGCKYPKSVLRQTKISKPTCKSWNKFHRDTTYVMTHSMGKPTISWWHYGNLFPLTTLHFTPYSTRNLFHRLVFAYNSGPSMLSSLLNSCMKNDGKQWKCV